MEDAEQQILEMFVAGYHAGQILEIGREFLEFNDVIGFDVVPTPYELVEGFPLALFVGQYFGMSLGVVYFAQLFQGYLAADDLAGPFVGIDDAFITAFVRLSSEVVQEGLISDLFLVFVRFYQVFEFVFAEEYLAALQAPPEITLLQHPHSVRVQTAQHFVQESHAVDSPFGQQVFDLLIEGEFVDYFVFEDGLVELLFRGGGAENEP
jgi:hypothetical protein